MDVLIASAAAPVVLLAALLWRLRSLEAPRVFPPSRPPSRPGLWYCSHRADVRFPFQHLFLRITPADAGWARRDPGRFCQVDAEGRPYCTLGAGPRDGRLFLEFNRAFDLGDPVGCEEAALCRGVEEENARIEALFKAAEAYGQSLAFTAWTRVSGRGYNCNSMIHALAARAGLDMPRFSRRLMLCPGAGRGLPESAFKA